MTTIEIYDWTEIKRIASNDEYGCQYYEDCPDCNCGDDVAYAITYARPRWSKSNKRFVEETYTEWVCSAHAE
jgi:hypothetical protein